MPITDRGEPFKKLTEELEGRGYRLTNHKTIKLEQSVLVLYGVVTCEAGKPMADSYRVVVEHWPDDGFDIWLGGPMSVSTIADRIIYGKVPPTVRETIGEGLDALEQQFEDNRAAFDDYSEDDVTGFEKAMKEARDWNGDA